MNINTTHRDLDLSQVRKGPFPTGDLLTGYILPVIKRYLLSAYCLSGIALSELHASIHSNLPQPYEISTYFHLAFL